MDKTTNLLLHVLSFLLAVSLFLTAEARSRSLDRDDEAILVGRISHVEGDVFRYVPEEDDWVVIVKDAPFGLEDGLYAEKGRAELIMPNNTWVRIDRETQIQLLDLREDLTEIDVAQGVARFQNRGSYALIRAGTPFGYVTAPEDTAFEVFVTEEAADIIPIKGTVEFVHRYSGTRYEVKAGSSSLLTDNRRVIAGEGHEDADWNAWNRQRDILWANRMEHKGKSGAYLPPGLYDHAYVLEDYGRWDRVYYGGGYYHFWRPVHISVGWSPFTTGRWSVWYGHHTWIPYEPFGYVTHHYGNWIYTHGYWYWAPPMHWGGFYAGAPGFHLDFSWYPGRVAWIHHGYHVGWIPLAPYEPYYCHRHWGRRSVVVRNVDVTNVYVNINKYENQGRAVVVRERDLYNVNDYGNVRVRGVSAALVSKQYRVTPGLSARGISGHPKGKQEYQFTNVKGSGKPPATARVKSGQNRPVIDQHRTAQTKTVVKEKISAIRDIAGTKVQSPSTAGKANPLSVKSSRQTAPTLEMQEKRLEKKTTVTAKDRSQIQNSARTPGKVTTSKPLKEQIGSRLPQPGFRAKPEVTSNSLHSKTNRVTELPRARNEAQKKPNSMSFSSGQKNLAVPSQNLHEVPRSSQGGGAKAGQRIEQWQGRMQERPQAGSAGNKGLSFQAPSPKTHSQGVRKTNRGRDQSPRNLLGR